MVPQEFDPILLRAMENDREALDQLFSIHRARLYKLALRLMGNPEDAEDVLQDGLLSAYVHLNKFEGRAQLSTWLTRIVMNAAFMRRRRRRVTTTSIDQQLDRNGHPLAIRISDSSPNPEEWFVREERLEILEGAIWRLSPALLRAFWLRDVRGMSTREAAKVSGIPEGSIKAQLHRARRRLRKEVIKPRRARAVARSKRMHVGATLSKPDLAWLAAGADFDS